MRAPATMQEATERVAAKERRRITPEMRAAIEADFAKACDHCGKRHTITEVAMRHGVSRSTVFNIVNRLENFA